MIRNVVMGRLRVQDDDEAAERDRHHLQEALIGILALDLPGMVDNQAGLDLGLREGGWDFAITNDWRDAESYRGYDVDPTHGRYRALIVEVSEQLVRVQIDLD